MIRLRTLLTESVTINGVTLRAANSKHGGPVEASWEGNTATYRVSLSSALYNGPIGVTSIWKQDGQYYVLTNKDQREEIKLDQLSKLVTGIIDGEEEIEIGGRAWSTITFTKKD